MWKRKGFEWDVKEKKVVVCLTSAMCWASSWTTAATWCRARWGKTPPWSGRSWCVTECPSGSSWWSSADTQLSREPRSSPSSSMWLRWLSGPAAGTRSSLVTTLDICCSSLQKLRALQNFNTLMAVTGGLCHSSISRLKDTFNLLPPDITKVLSRLRLCGNDLDCQIVTHVLLFACSQALSELTELLSSRSNYINYRRVYNECSGFKVPILGVHLKDLISLNEALPDYISEDKINVSKLQHLYSNISDLLAIHSCTPPFEANKDLLHLLTVWESLKGDLEDRHTSQWSHHDFISYSFNVQLSLDLYYTEDEIYELSYTKEPKNPKIQVSLSSSQLL